MAKKRRTTFLKTQKERARLEKQAEKRARRQNRETDLPRRLDRRSRRIFIPLAENRGLIAELTV